MHKNTVTTGKACLFLLVALTIACGPSTQETTEDTVPIRDETGASLTRDELVARLSTGDWAAEPVHDDQGAVVEIVVTRSSGEREHAPSGNDLPPGAIMIDGGVPIRDEDGVEISFEEFMDRMNSGGWRPEPTHGEDGEWVEMVLIRDQSVKPPMDSFPGEVTAPSLFSEHWSGKPLPELQLTTLQGKDLGPADFEDHVVVLNFWFRACKPCMMETPELNELVAKFEDEDVVFVALTFDGADEARAALEKHPFSYHVVADARDLHGDFEIESYPTHLIYDRDHRCTAALSGYTPGFGRMLQKEISAALDEGS